MLLLYDVLRWEEKSFIEAAGKLGVELKPLHVPSLCSKVGETNTEDIVLQRCTSFYNALESAIFMESLGADVINRSDAIMICQDKLWTTSILARKGIPVPNTYVAFSHESVRKAADVLGYPFVIKPIHGSWGRMLALIDDEEDLRMVTEHRMYMPNPIQGIYYAQEFVRKPGRDIRVFVVGDEVPVAIYRYSDHWITNTARGGKAVPAHVDSELEEIALKTSEAVKGQFLGIDILEHPERGYIVDEVNAVTEFKNTVAATGYDLARKVLEFAVKKVRR
ncbi:MAG: lysine biosynthesis protein LysX [Candidatus Methanodesulfokora sp.]|jgi:[lysine-biosynthesis-protein LysW]--L-2-aminoadipate ligase